MGQAKARGSKDQRVAEAVERARVAEIAHNLRKEAERKAEAEMLARRQAAWELRNAERLARGEEPLPKRSARNVRLQASTLLAVAAMSLAYR